MDSLFIIPTLISPEVDDRIVPAVCKLVERSILLQNSSLLRKAAIMKFLGKGKGLNSEAQEIYDKLENLVNLTEGRMTSAEKAKEKADLLKQQKKQHKQERKERREDKQKEDEEEEAAAEELKKQERKKLVHNFKRPGVADDPTKYDPKPVFGDKEKPEVAKGIAFYSAVSLEPTYLEIPLMGRAGLGDDQVSRIIRVGMKSVPYKLEGIKYLKDYLYKVKGRSLTSSTFQRKMSRLKKYIYGWNKDYRQRPYDFLNIAPTAKELRNPKFLSRSMGGNVISLWAPLTVFSHYDFRDAELKENLWTYDQLVKGGWGNMVIIDDDRQIVYFCMQEVKACYQLTFTYLKKMLDMEDVINASGTVSRSSRPMSPGKSVGPSSIFSNIGESLKIDSIKSTLNELEELIGSVKNEC